MSPSSHPSRVPTTSPSKIPTVYPSDVPTGTRDLVPVQAMLPLEFRVTTGLLTGETESEFVITTEAFLSSELTPEVSSIEVTIIDQDWPYDDNRRTRRILQSNGGVPLYVDLSVSGFLVDEDPSYDFEAILVDIFESQSETYTSELKSTGNPYFQTIETVAVTEQPPSPTSAPIDDGTGGDDDDEQDDDDDSSSSFPIGGIIGIAVGGIVVIAFGVWFLRDRIQKQAGPGGRHGKNDYRRGEPPSTPLADADEKNSQKLDIQEKDSDLESHAVGTVYSYAQGDQTVMANESIIGMDNMSYAYSLEPGLDTNTVDGSYSARAIPKEIPQIGGGGSSRQQGSNRTGSSRSQITGDGDAAASGVTSFNSRQAPMDSPSIGASMATEDLKLTESEIAMLPSDLANTTIDSNLGKDEPPTRQVTAPPGKLGIVIDTTVEGPVVHYVNETSALQGKIWEGDIIVAIGDVDTRAMSASAITDLMVKTANQQRVLTVLGEAKN